MKARKQEEKAPTATEPTVDLKRIAAMGKEIINALQSLRELLGARATALEHCGAALEEHHTQLLEKAKSSERQEAEVCRQLEQREVELGKREDRCAQLEQDRNELEKARDHQSAELLKRKQEMDAQASEIESRRHAVAEVAASLANKEQRLADGQKAVDEKSSELEAERLRIEGSSREFREKAAGFQERASDLDAQHATLDEAQAELHQQSEQLEKRSDEIEGMSNNLGQREDELGQRETDLAAQEDVVSRKVADLQCAQTNLAELQKQLNDELTRLADSKNDLLPVYGLTDQGLQTGEPATGGVPEMAGIKARASVERFQKLCRDAKRRAVGN